MYEKIAADIDQELQQMMSNIPAASSCATQMTSLQNLVDILKTGAQHRDITRTEMSAVALLQKVLSPSPYMVIFGVNKFKFCRFISSFCQSVPQDSI